MTSIYKDDLLENIKKKYNNISYENKVNDQVLIVETKKFAPHLHESFIKKHIDLIHYLNESYKKAKRSSGYLLIESITERNKYIKDRILFDYIDYNLRKSKNPDHFIDLMLETYSVIFHPVKKKNKVLLERNVNVAKDKEPEKSSSGSSFRLEFDPNAELDHTNPDDQDPTTVAYWKRVAKEEPDAEDIKPFIKFMKYYEKGYNPHIIYSIPENEPGGYDPSKPTLPPKIQKKLYNRYKLKKTLKNRGLEKEEIEKILVDFDKENKIEEVIFNTSEEYENYSVPTIVSQTKKSGEEKEDKKEKPGFFGRAFGWIRNKFKSLFADPKEAAKTKEEMDKLKISQEKKKSLWERIKNTYSKIKDSVFNSKWGKTLGKILKFLLPLGIMYAVGLALPFLGPVGVWIGLTIKLIMGIRSLYSSGKEIVKIFDQMREGKSGLQAVVQVIKNLVEPKYFGQTFFLLFHIVIMYFALMGLKETVGQITDELKKLGSALNVPKDQINDAAKKATEASKDAAQEGTSQASSGASSGSGSSQTSTSTNADSGVDASSGANTGSTATQAGSEAGSGAGSAATQASAGSGAGSAATQASAGSGAGSAATQASAGSGAGSAATQASAGSGAGSAATQASAGSGAGSAATQAGSGAGASAAKAVADAASRYSPEVMAKVARNNPQGFIKAISNLDPKAIAQKAQELGSGDMSKGLEMLERSLREGINALPSDVANQFVKGGNVTVAQALDMLLSSKFSFAASL